MTSPDLNLLTTLDVLLAEGSVAKASRRLNLSASAMSRALSRLRASTGDPLLVRAGRGLVPTPRALELRERVRQVVSDAEALLLPAVSFDLRTVKRTLTLRTSDGFVENFGARLVLRAAQEAPGIRLRFVQKLSKDSAPLRDGGVDLDTGLMGEEIGPEVRLRALFRDRFIGVVRKGHPLARGAVTVARYAEHAHVLVARRGGESGLMDGYLRALDTERTVAVTVSGFAAALALARGTDLVATVPAHHTHALRAGMFSFDLPFHSEPFTVSMFWHPRHDADPAHRWLRSCVYEACSTGPAASGAAAPPSGLL